MKTLLVAVAATVALAALVRFVWKKQLAHSSARLQRYYLRYIQNGSQTAPTQSEKRSAAWDYWLMRKTGANYAQHNRMMAELSGYETFRHI